MIQMMSVLEFRSEVVYVCVFVRFISVVGVNWENNLFICVIIFGDLNK